MQAMNRDRAIIGVLVVLLVASLALNGVLWKRSRSPAAAVATETPAAKGRTSPPRDAGKPAQFELVANPELKGRLGRIVLQFSDEVKLEGHSTRTVIYAAGKPDSLKTDYNAFAADLPPGKYDLEVAGKKVSGVVVESGKDTRVRSGILRTHGSANTRMVICDVGSPDALQTVYGNAMVGLPVGEYEIEVSGVREKVTVEQGKVTEF
jgi:hypothetical protein